MTGRIPTAFLVIVVASVLPQNTEAASWTDEVVPGTANIFGAGRSAVPEPGGGGGGTLPLGYLLPSGVNRVFRIIDASGTVDCCDGNFPNGPDGTSEFTTNIDSYLGVSGIRDDLRAMFLTGVFLNDLEPVDPAPSSLDFTGAEGFSELSPELNQTFFIGDGLTATASGMVQVFHVPDDATRLYLGFADGFLFQGPPGYYDDNTGELTVSFLVVPEPSTYCLLLAATTVVTQVFRRRQHSKC